MAPIVDNEPLTPQDKTLLDYFYGLVADRLASSKANTWVELKFPKTVRPKILAILKQRIEVSGRQVGMFDESEHWRFTFPPVVATLPPVKALPGSIPFAAGHTGPRVLLRMPTRDRPARALDTLVAYRNKAGYPIDIEIVVNADDEKSLSSEVLQRFCALEATVTVGSFQSKVEAVNGGEVSDWDILIVASDDMVPVENGYARIIVDEMQRHFPHFDGLIYFNDGHVGERCCTLPIFGRRIYAQFGYVYHPTYISLCCDMEQTDLFRSMNRLAYVDRLLIEHQHPAAQKAPFDALYDRNERFKSRDSQNYESRRKIRRSHAQFEFDSPPLVLSICIASLPVRRRQLERLVSYLYGQIVRDAPRRVEILVDDGPGAIGAKRQRLIERALGHYVAHIDDDDWVSHDYVKRVVDAVADSDYSADCVSLSGAMTVNGNESEPFYHSIKHKEWYSANGAHFRSPNHLNPVRREIALRGGFPVESSHGEDHEFSKRILPFLNKEVSPGEGPIYHYWYSRR